MRLVCPNCEAQYEINSGLIPPDGRDVQCSNCGHIWFETIEAARPELSIASTKEPPSAPAKEPVVPRPPPPFAPREDDGETTVGTKAKSGADEQPKPDTTLKPEAEPAHEPDHASEPEPESSLDPDVARILREEAEAQRHLRERRREGQDTSPDLGLHSVAPSDADDAGDGRDARDAPLPDVAEINSSFRARDEAPSPKERDGFWGGFWGAVAVAALAAALYVFAPQIGDAVPGLDPALDGYREWVDGIRLWLDARIRDLRQ